MPYGLDGFGSSNHQDNMSLESYGGRGDARTLLPPAEYHANPLDYRLAPPRAAPVPPITTYPYGSLAEPVNRSPQWFDFPHLTRHPVPAALPIWAPLGPPQSGGNTWHAHPQTGLSCLQSSQPHNPAVHHSLEARKASISSLDSGIIMPPDPMRGPDARVSRNELQIPCPHFEPATSPPFSNYAQHSGNGHMRPDAACQYGLPSEPRYACLFAKLPLLMASFVGTGGQQLIGSKRMVLAR